MLDPHVVVLEDDLELRSLVTRGLREEGFAVSAVETRGSGDVARQRALGRRDDRRHRAARRRRARRRPGAAGAAATTSRPLPHGPRRTPRPPLRLRGRRRRLPDEAVRVRRARRAAARAREARRRRPVGAGRRPRASIRRRTRRSCGGDARRADPDRVPPPGAARRQPGRGGPAPPARRGGLGARRDRPRQHARRLRRPPAAQAEAAPRCAARSTTVHGVGYSLR